MEVARPDSRPAFPRGRRSYFSFPKYLSQQFIEGLLESESVSIQSIVRIKREPEEAKL